MSANLINQPHLTKILFQKLIVSKSHSKRRWQYKTKQNEMVQMAFWERLGLGDLGLEPESISSRESILSKSQAF